MPKIAQRQFVTKVAGLADNWATFSGGEPSVEVSRDFDGGSLVPDLTQGNPAISDITVGRGFDPGRDGPIRARLSRLIASGKPFRTTITRTPVDEDLSPTGAEPEVYEVQLRGVTPSESDANSATTARIQLMFAVRTVR